MFNSRKQYIMETLLEELKGLKEALKNKTVTVNEYCSLYHATSKKIENLKTAPLS